MIDDDHLIDQTLRGQTEAFGQLVLKYQDRLFNTVFHVVGHAEDARDIVQEALVQAFLKLDSFEHRQCVLHVAVSHRLQRGRGPSAAANEASLDGLRETNHTDPAAWTTRRRGWSGNERCGQVRQALAQLPPEHRAVLVLREIDGCDYATIAEILDLPVGTVRSRLHRGRLQLREALTAVLASTEEIGEHGEGVT